MTLEYSTEIDRDIIANHPVHQIRGIRFFTFYPRQCKLVYSTDSVSEVITHIVAFTLSTIKLDPVDVCLHYSHTDKYITRTGKKIKYHTETGVLQIVHRRKTFVLSSDNLESVEIEPIHDYSEGAIR